MANLKAQMAINNNEDTVLQFIRNNGQFLFISKEDTSFRLLRTALSTGLTGSRFSLSLIRYQEMPKMFEQIENYLKRSQYNLLIIDIKTQNDSSNIRDLRSKFSRNQIPILVLMQEMGDNVINLLKEMGANNIVVSPYSPINLIEKIANTLKPSGLSEIIENCQKLLSQKQYQAVIRVCDKILKLKPGSSAAHMLKGDAFLGMSQNQSDPDADSHRKSALNFYMLAWQGNSKYVEPIKRLVNYYKADANIQEQLHFLKELDTLSPLNIDRKIEIGLILINNLKEKKKVESADNKEEIAKEAEEITKFLDMAVDLAKKENNEEQLKLIYQSISNALADLDPELAKKYTQP